AGGTRGIALLESTGRFRQIAGADTPLQALYFLRRPAVRYRPAPPWPSGRLDPERHHSPLLHDAGLLRAAPFWLGLPRPADRTRNRQNPWHVVAAGGGQTWHQGLQRRMPRYRAALYRRMGKNHYPHRPLGGL